MLRCATSVSCGTIPLELTTSGHLLKQTYLVSPYLNYINPKPLNLAEHSKVFPHTFEADSVRMDRGRHAGSRAPTGHIDI